jgi:hypothetical protein
VITIFQTRYRGTYEGGVWAAVYSRPRDIPEEVLSGDTLASRLWLDHERLDECPAYSR